eukprot:2583414-Amphidinium_carterae.2
MENSKVESPSNLDQKPPQRNSKTKQLSEQSKFLPRRKETPPQLWGKGSDYGHNDGKNSQHSPSASAGTA